MESPVRAGPFLLVMPGFNAPSELRAQEHLLRVWSQTIGDLTVRS
jgi:hypothetical protein